VIARADAPRRTVGVLLAGGSGVRTGLEYPKQFLRIGGRTVLEHTLSAFEAADGVDEVIIVSAPAWIETAAELISECGAEKVSAIIAGGETRNDSTRAAIAFLSDERGLADAKLLIHDAVRPLVSVAILEDCVRALDFYDAVDVVVETADTIVEVADHLVTGIPTRERLRRGQTPQAFSLRLLHDAYATVATQGAARFTDDCAVVLAAFPHAKVLALPGAEENMKITHAIDIYLADRLLQVRQTPAPSGATGAPPAGVVAVIGGSSGIGAATVELLAAAGGDAASLSRRDGDVDVRDERSVRDALAQLRAARGPIAAVVNCAGLLTPGELTELDGEQIREQLDVNLLGSIHVARAAHSFLRESAGQLLLFTSSSYTRGRGGYAVYSATKAAVVNLAQALAEEWHGDAIRVNCINPARTNTPMRTHAFGPESAASLLEASTVADAVAAVLRSEGSGHVYDVRLERGTATGSAAPATAAAA
jgi:2-C-methyl-D-erythritol 4-phosphate cytidylyltransferase